MDYNEEGAQTARLKVAPVAAAAVAGSKCCKPDRLGHLLWIHEAGGSRRVVVDQLTS